MYCIIWMCSCYLVDELNSCKTTKKQECVSVKASLSLDGVFVVLDWLSTNVPNYNTKCSDSSLKLQTKWSVWALGLVTCTWSPGSDRSSWMFKSVLSQQVNGFFSFLRTRSAVYLLLVSSFFYFIFYNFFSPFLFNGHVLKFTHNAQPNKLTDSCMGHGVIRWRQYQLSIQSASRSAITASLISCLCLPTCVLSPRLLCWQKCLRHAGTWLPPPSCLCVTFASAQARISLLLSGVTKGIYTAFYSIYCRIEMPNAALFLVCFDVR